MRAFLLCAGVGSRLRPITDHVPKCLVPICGEPLLAIWLRMLDRAGIERFLINTHHKAEAVERFVADHPLRERIDLVNEPELLGTGGSLRAYRRWFGDQPAIIAHADNLSLCDFSEFIATHRRRRAGTIVTMMTFTTDTPESCGIIDLSPDGAILSYREKEKGVTGTLANAAVYVAEPEFLDQVAGLEAPAPDISPDISRDVIPAMLERTHTFFNAVYHRDIGTPESYAIAQQDYRRYLDGLNG